MSQDVSPDKNIARQQLIELTQELWKSGYVNKDVNLVSGLLHEDFKLVDDEGSVFSKEKELSYVADYGDQYEHFSFEIVQVDVFGNGTGIVRTDCKFSGSDSESAFTTKYTQSLTFAQIGGEWKLIYSQVSGVEEERF